MSVFLKWHDFKVFEEFELLNKAVLNTFHWFSQRVYLQCDSFFSLHKKQNFLEEHFFLLSRFIFSAWMIINRVSSLLHQECYVLTTISSPVITKSEQPVHSHWSKCALGQGTIDYILVAIQYLFFSITVKLRKNHVSRCWEYDCRVKNQ